MLKVTKDGASVTEVAGAEHIGGGSSCSTTRDGDSGSCVVVDVTWGGSRGGYGRGRGGVELQGLHAHQRGVGEIVRSMRNADASFG